VNVALWIVQVVLGLMFLLAGVLKSFRPPDDLAGRMTWVSAVPPALVRFIGVAELLAGIGLILPAATGVLPGLTIWAGVGLGVVMICAAAFHIPRREYSGVATNAVILVLAAFVAYGRWQVAPF